MTGIYSHIFGKIRFWREFMGFAWLLELCDSSLDRNLEVDDGGFNGTNQAFGQGEMGEPPEQLLDTESPDGFDADVDGGGLGREPDAEGRLIIARNDLSVPRPELDSAGL